MIRFFRAVEYVNEFLKALTLKDDVEKYLSLWKAFWLAVWMSMDHIQWLQKVGYIKLADLKKIDEYHSKGWFFGLAAGLIIAAYKFKQAVDENKTARAQLTQSTNDPAKIAAANKALKAGDESIHNKQHQVSAKRGDAMVLTKCVFPSYLFVCFLVLQEAQQADDEHDQEWCRHHLAGRSLGLATSVGWYHGYRRYHHIDHRHLRHMAGIEVKRGMTRKTESPYTRAHTAPPNKQTHTASTAPCQCAWLPSSHATYTLFRTRAAWAYVQNHTMRQKFDQTRYTQTVATVLF